MKRIVYFVVGMGGSGTRLTTRLFMKAGCYGDGRHRQSLDSFADGPHNTAESVIVIKRGACYPNGLVFRRSFPNHGGRIPDLRALRQKFVEDGYKVTWVVVMRRAARFEYKYEGYDSIFSVIKAVGDDWLMFNTSLLFLEPERYLHELGQMTGLDFSGSEKILNPDMKLFYASISDIPDGATQAEYEALNA